MNDLIKRKDALTIAQTATHVGRNRTGKKPDVYEVRQAIQQGIKNLPNEEKKPRFTVFEVVSDLLDYGYHSGKFSWGETIKFTPSEVGEILMEKAKEKC